MLELLSEFIPQIVFLMCTFGYMVILIFIKWNTDFTGRTSEAPSILNTMLHYGLGFGQTYGEDLYGGEHVQTGIQILLLILAF